MNSTETVSTPSTTPFVRSPMAWSSELALMWGTTFVLAVLCAVTWFVC